jgi:hypothetical protein
MTDFWQLGYFWTSEKRSLVLVYPRPHADRVNVISNPTVLLLALGGFG